MPLLRKDQIAQLLKNEEMLATPLLITCVEEFGVDFFEWEPETFDMECVASFGTEIPTANRDKIWALVTVLTTDQFHKSLEAFLPIANALNGSEADFDDYDPVTGEEAAWAIVETELIDPPLDGGKSGSRFSHEIRRYIGITLQTEGITTPPKILMPHVEYDRDPEENVGAVVGSDPHLLQMYEMRQAEGRKRIEEYVRDRLALLAGQLRSLPTTSYSTVRSDRYLQRFAAASIG